MQCLILGKGGNRMDIKTKSFMLLQFNVVVMHDCCCYKIRVQKRNLTLS